ncbi:MAG: tetratricopeptide repeat protein [Fulvivirga sp.]|nr:tetratricopeptide repeat protein [Fulvivirga sp.]
MLKTRIFLAAAAILLVVLIFNLPRVVVSNDPDSITGDANENAPSDSTAMAAHVPELSPEDRDRAEALKEKLELAKNTEKSIIFADSLAALYLKIGKYDSAARFIEIVANENPSLENLKRAGNVYYEAYGFAMDAERQAALGEKAQSYFSLILKEEPDNLEVKNKLAMTYLTTSNPMMGIMMLREILEEDPDNEEALFNMGVLSMQSGQYEKAVERFEDLTAKYSDNIQAQFFLGVSYLETGKKEKARTQFELVKTLDEDPAVHAAADAYLEEIN